MKRFVLPIVVLTVVGWVATGAWADHIPFPSNHAIELVFENYDQGTRYTFPSDGTYKDTDTPPLSSHAAGPVPGGNGTENGWGIFKLDDILDLDTATTIWQSGPSAEITGMFWGLTDHQVTQDSITGNQEIRSTGLNFAFWYDTTPDFNPVPGPLTRNVTTGAPVFPTVTDGDLIWSGHSVVGGVPDGMGVDPTNEFVSNYKFGSNTSKGEFYADMGGAAYTDGGGSSTLVGSDNHQFALWQPNAPQPYLADIAFQFTGFNTGKGAWELRSGDPGNALTETQTPELSSISLLLSGLVPMIGVGRLRRRKRA